MKFPVSRVGVGLATAALTVLASTACGPSGPTHATPKAVRHSELVGRWDGNAECGSPLPVIRLRDDYTFSAKDVPVEWDGPGTEVTRRSLEGKWHAINKDPGLTPYLVLKYENENRIMPFFLEGGELWVSGDVQAGGGDPYIRSCEYRRTSPDPESGR
ncbi:hypothetical protein [Streptomyces sp. NPDC101115]|uniref:hypothetical protein n=1 Tax=Streptomyces sp. NPDC101115 TaxID=3366106 RepID=UPI00382E8B80